MSRMIDPTGLTAMIKEWTDLIKTVAAAITTLAAVKILRRPLSAATSLLLSRVAPRSLLAPQPLIVMSIVGYPLPPAPILRFKSIVISVDRASSTPRPTWYQGTTTRLVAALLLCISVALVSSFHYSDPLPSVSESPMTIAINSGPQPASSRSVIISGTVSDASTQDSSHALYLLIKLDGSSQEKGPWYVAAKVDIGRNGDWTSTIPVNYIIKKIKQPSTTLSVVAVVVRSTHLEPGKPFSALKDLRPVAQSTIQTVTLGSHSAAR